jgi:hypothetical protein
MPDAMPAHIARLQAGKEVKLRPRGQSMVPVIRSGQLVTIAPLKDCRDLQVGDVVLSRVQGAVRLHKISAIDKPSGRVQISNNHGHVNGWTGYSKVYGILIRVEP